MDSTVGTGVEMAEGAGVGETGTGVETAEGVVVGETAGACVGKDDGAIVVEPIEHARSNTAMPPAPSVAAIDTKSLLELVFVDCVIPATTPLMVSASLPTLTVLGV